MKKVYAHQNLALVGAMRSYLQQHGIDCQIRNEFAASGIGEAVFYQAWPEVWVGENQVAQALQLIAAMHQDEPQSADWKCRRCLAENPANFATCWQCGHACSAPANSADR